MVHGVSRISLPSCNVPLRKGDDLPCTGDNQAGNNQELGFVSDFIAGPENELAVAALDRLLSGGKLETAAELFNPLVLLGPSGTGKSHLARGVARHWRERGDTTDIEYLAAIDFARQLRAAREENQLEDFRQRMASVELLVLEDLQGLPLSVYVQRELRDTLDVLDSAGAMLLVTAQQPPSTMEGLETGLRDRLASGLTVRLQFPGIESREKLLQLSATARGVELGDEQLRQLASRIEGPAPQLFRALAEHELSATVPTLSEAAHPPIPLKQIIAVVARYFSLTQAALRSSARRKSLVYARGIAIHLARSLTNLSYAQIGVSLGRRDHSTVMHAARTIEQRLANDAHVQRDIEELRHLLTAV